MKITAEVRITVEVEVEAESSTFDEALEALHAAIDEDYSFAELVTNSALYRDARFTIDQSSIKILEEKE